MVETCAKWGRKKMREKKTDTNRDRHREIRFTHISFMGCRNGVKYTHTHTQKRHNRKATTIMAVEKKSYKERKSEEMSKQNLDWSRTRDRTTTTTKTMRWEGEREREREMKKLTKSLLAHAYTCYYFSRYSTLQCTRMRWMVIRDKFRIGKILFTLLCCFAPATSRPLPILVRSCPISLNKT